MKLDWEENGDGDWCCYTKSVLGPLIVQREEDGLYRAFWSWSGHGIGKGRFRTSEKALADAEKDAEKQIQYLCKAFGYIKKKVKK